MTQSDILAALIPVVDTLEELNVGYYIGGSIASSAHGIPRSTLDVDLIADLNRSHVGRLFLRLKDRYYIDDKMVSHAVSKRSTFNIIHLDTAIKLDVFVFKRDAFGLDVLKRACDKALDSPEESSRLFAIASAEDIVIQKLLWYREGGCASIQQWSDVIGVLKVQANALDLSYMRRWAENIKVIDLLNKALIESGIE